MYGGYLISMSRLSKDVQEQIIANSIEIYENEIELKKKGNNFVGLCPLHGENTPSFNIKSEYPWLFKCYGCGKAGNVVNFIAELKKISYSEAISFIQGMKIDLKKEIKIVQKEKKELIVDWCEMPFSDKHKKYFDAYELDEKFLATRDIYALKTIAINKRIQKFPNNQFKFVYFAKDINQIKVLTLGEGVEKGEKWRSFNIPNTYIWDAWRYKGCKCEKLMVCKSNKDAAVFAKLNYCSVSLQSEDATTFINHNVELIKSISDNPYIIMGTDMQGFETSLSITQATGFKWFNVPKRYYKVYQANDTAELVRVYNLQKLQKELNIKGI